MPRWWREFEIIYRRGRTTYRIKVENPLAVHRCVISLELDGALQTVAEISLTDDGQTHAVRVVLGEKPAEVTEPSEAVNELKGRAGSSQ